MEEPIINILKLNGYEVQFCNELWVHKHFPWLSCTSDGVIINNGKMVAAIEIKTFTSLENLKRTVLQTNRHKYVNPKSREYFQIQAIASILDVPYVVMVYEYGGTVDKVVVKHNLDFIWYYHEIIKERYLRHVVPFNLYGLPKIGPKKSGTRVGYFDEGIYQRLLALLLKHQSRIGYDEEESPFEYYPIEKPSEVNNTYFELFTDTELINKLIYKKLNPNNIIIS